METIPIERLDGEYGVRSAGSQVIWHSAGVAALNCLWINPMDTMFPTQQGSHPSFCAERISQNLLHVSFLPPVCSSVPLPASISKEKWLLSYAVAFIFILGAEIFIFSAVADDDCSVAQEPYQSREVQTFPLALWFVPLHLGIKAYIFFKAKLEVDRSGNYIKLLIKSVWFVPPLYCKKLLSL